MRTGPHYVAAFIVIGWYHPPQHPTFVLEEIAWDWLGPTHLL